MKRYHPDTIIDVVGRVSGVPFDDIVSRSRHEAVTQARGILVTLLRRHTTLSYPEIAKRMGRKWHSSCHTAETRFRSDPNHRTILAPYIAALELEVPTGHFETLEERVETLEAAMAGAIRMLADIPTNQSNRVAREEAA